MKSIIDAMWSSIVKSNKVVTLYLSMILGIVGTCGYANDIHVTKDVNRAVLGDWYEAHSDDESTTCARWDDFWMGANVAIPVTGLSTPISASDVVVTAGTYSEFGTPIVLSESEMWSQYGAPVLEQKNLGNVDFDEYDNVWQNWDAEEDGAYGYELSADIWPNWTQESGRQWILIPTGVPRLGTHTFSVKINGIEHDEYVVSFVMAEDQEPVPDDEDDNDDCNNVHDKVQLWEGGPYWATTNIGAKKPEDYGYYFWWGDTIGYKRENDKWVASDGSNSNFSFTESNTPTYGKDNSTLQSEGWITSDGVLVPEHDAAQKHWGGDWRMPTRQEFNDLFRKCDWVWISRNGVNGYIVQGEGDYSSVSIFLPCAGYGGGTSHDEVGSFSGRYWSSVSHSNSSLFDSSFFAWHLNFNSAGGLTTYYFNRYLGLSVRPVQGFNVDGDGDKIDVVLGDWYEAHLDDVATTCARWDDFWMGANVAIPVTGLSTPISASDVVVTAGTYSEFGTPIVLSESEMWSQYGAPVLEQKNLGNVDFDEYDNVWQNWDAEEDGAYGYELSADIWPNWTQVSGRQWILIPTGVPRLGTHTFSVKINGVEHDEYVVSFVMAEDQEPVPYVCKVLFNPNGGELSESESERNVPVGETVGVLPLPMRNGYTFIGWFTAETGGVSVTAEFIITAETVLYAQWESKAEKIGMLFGGEWSVERIGEADVNNCDNADVAQGEAIKFTAEDSSSIQIETEVTNACRVTFKWKSSCEPLIKGEPWDYLSFIVDGEQKGFICGETAWQEFVFDIDGQGVHKLKWKFRRDGDGSAGDNSAWLADLMIASVINVSFVPGGATDGNVPNSISSYSGENFLLPDQGSLLFPKHTFVGWSDGISFYDSGAIYTGESNVVMTAQWARNELAMPVISAPETFEADSCEVTIACDNGATIHYTLDGADPTAESPFYTGPIVITGTTEIKAIAIRDNYFDSPIASFTVTRGVWTLGEYLNCPEQEFMTGGDAEWIREKGVSEDGYALKSGDITHSQTSRVETVVMGPGMISFSCRVEGEILKGNVYDGLAFFIDGVQQGNLMGDRSWTTYSYDVAGEGTHTLTWAYVKDDGDVVDVGEDCAWLDEVIWMGGEKFDITYENLKGATHTNPDSYREGTVVSFASPSKVSDYTFAGWTPSQITADMTGDIVVTANWDWEPQDASVDASVTSWKPVTVKADWVKTELEQKFGAGKKASFIAKFGDNFTSAMTKKTGKRDSAGKELLVWHDYVAGTDPTDINSTFKTKIEMQDGKPIISWEPNLNSLGDERVYTVYGKEKLSDIWHSPIAALDHFFKVDVAMPREGTVTFDVGGGSSVNPISVRVGQPLGELPTPTRVGYTFLGWFTAQEGGVAVTPETVVTSDMTIYARWMIKSYTVVFDANGGSGGVSKSYNHGAPLDEMPVPTREGYEFVGWFTAANGGSQVTASTVVTGSQTLYARWKTHEKVLLWEGGPYWATTNIGAENPENYGYYFWWGDTVGYKRENGKWVASDGSNSNFSFTKSNTPTSNKSFSTLQSEGWVTANGALALEHDAAHVHWGGDWRMPTKQEFDDLNSKCDWTRTTMNGVTGYIVRGRGDYSSASIFLPCAGYGSWTSLDNFGSAGYYWSSVPNSDDNSVWFLFFSGNRSTYYDSRYYGRSVRPVQGVSCVAVTFDACGGSSVDSISIPLGQAIGELPVPTRNGYTFVGWFTAQEGGEAVTPETIVIADTTIYARWELFDIHEKVQLWKGGPYWATTNIGAENPEDYGYYFWWGDTVGYKRENDKWVASDGSNSNFSFDDSNTPTYNKSTSTLQSEGWITADGVLALEHDAAQAQWGGDWRMPTKQEFDNLNSKCDWTWTTVNGVNGYIVRGRGDYSSASIFLPCAGEGYGTSLYNAGSYVHYWSSVPHSDYYGFVWYLYFHSSNHGTSYDHSRDYGRSVRPLQGFTK